ncbi:MAG TPA: HNH endonuclease, partial [Anaeromyxobacteraceae bacterium]
RRFPMMAELLRDGQLCLTTLRLLEPVLTDENAAELIARAASKSKSEVERLVVAIQPRTIPKEGVRKLPDRSGAPSAAALPLAPRPAEPAVTTDAPWPHEAAMPLAPATRPTLQPVAEDTYSLRVTVDAAFKAELDELKALLSHKIPTGDLGAVLREAVRCAVEKHGKRKGAIVPARKAPKKAREPQRAASSVKARTVIPADVRRQVWKRDQGRCGWIGPDGRRCGSTWKLELQHVVEAALGGPSTVDNLALRCRGHNILDAEATFGRAHMARFRRNEPRTGESSYSGISASGKQLAEPGLLLEPSATS